ncbi:MAG: hypothetical protein M2R45_02933 [Verrucomicrobia subdivision 3 bacterium]|nr:hypothetical protein [Limisphaerales bacterium]MCS1415346.1 hypothetical protein [Limisphaerales bacterium]
MAFKDQYQAQYSEPNEEHGGNAAPISDWCDSRCIGNQVGTSICLQLTLGVPGVRGTDLLDALQDSLYCG